MEQFTKELQFYHRFRLTLSGIVAIFFEKSRPSSPKQYIPDRVILEKQFGVPNDPLAGTDIFPVRTLQALADVNVAKTLHAGS